MTGKGIFLAPRDDTGIIAFVLICLGEEGDWSFREIKKKE
jgi:hypothetical protein